MAVMRDRPYGNSNFLVDFGGEDSRALTAGFSEVIFPPFPVDQAGPDEYESMETQDTQSTDAAVGNHLVLKRGVIGTLDLYDWWKKARRGKEPRRRTVKIELLSDDHSTVVLTWRFRNVRPVSLSHSPLRAKEGGIVMETVELAFDNIEMS
jgi:phage tail-like protein